MQYEGESSVVQVTFTEKEMMCVVHPSSVLPEFSNSRNQQFDVCFFLGLILGLFPGCFYWFECYFPV